MVVFAVAAILAMIVTIVVGRSGTPQGAPMAPARSATSPVRPTAWREVAENGGAFVIPSSPEWTLEQKATRPGVNSVPITLALFRKGDCRGNPISHRAVVYMLPTDQVSSVDGIVAWARETATENFEGRSPTLAQEPAATGPGGRVSVTVTATAASAQGCQPPAQVVHAVGIPTVGPYGPRTLLLLATADQGVPDAVPSTELTTIVNSFQAR